MKSLVNIVGLVLVLSTVKCYIVDPGPYVIATKGEVWPKPQEQNKSDLYLVLKPALFQFKLMTNNDCVTLRNGFIRYQNIITSHYTRVEDNLRVKNSVKHKTSWVEDNNFSGYLLALDVYLNGECNDKEYPTWHMDEKYNLEIFDGCANLTSNSIWGILRGLETFSQLLYVSDDGFSLRINLTSINDYPRFAHRGLLVDTSRHYIPVKKILSMLEAMEYNKMNVFHWHIVDDQSFPYESQKFPELSEKGAYTSHLIYTISDVQLVIEYARERGIRVIPEFDSPGHTRSWGQSHRNLLTECYDNGVKTGDLGPIDPTKKKNYEFLAEFFQEIDDVFVDNYIHLGGDEVGFECWDSNPDIRNFMSKNNVSTYEQLESYYIQKLINIVDSLNASSIVWEEVFSNGVVLPKNTIVHVWLNTWKNVLGQITKSGRRAILSACWYLDHLQTGGDWQTFYKCEPFDFPGTEEQQKKIIGGEACMWSESVDESNIISRVWPRASATAERLWSDKDVMDMESAETRLEEHYCRLKRRGIGAQPPNRAGYCR